MTTGRAFALAALLSSAAAALPGAAAAQSIAAQPRLYLLGPDAVDARALWVNPAGLARRIEASIGGNLTVDDSARSLRVAQYGALLATRGFAAGWQRDDLTTGRNFDTYAVALGLGDEQFAMGFAKKWYRWSGAKDGAWDIGLHLAPLPAVVLSAVWRDIGIPLTRAAPLGDILLEETFIPGAALDVLGGRGHFALEWSLATTGWATRAVRLGAGAAVGRGVGFTLIADLSGTARLRGASFAVQISRPTARVSLFGRNASVRGATDRFGASGLIVAPPPAPGRFR